MGRKGNDGLLGVCLGFCSVTAGVRYVEGDIEDGVALGTYEG